MSLQRRSPMKRTRFARKPAGARHAARSKPLARGTSVLARAGRLKPRSAKRARVYKTRAELVAALLAEQPWCLIQWDEDCTHRSEDVHEPGMRSRGADITDPEQCTVTCRYCHDQVHANPEVATLLGWLIPSGRPAKAVPRHAAVTGRA